jgi:hypothetical protein
MLVYTRLPTGKKRRVKKDGPLAASKLSARQLQLLTTNEIPSYQHRSSQVVIPSHTTTTPFVPARTSVMDPANLAREAPEVQEAIVAKSMRLAPAYNKGAVQYITDGEDLTTLGRKIR